MTSSLSLMKLNKPSLIAKLVMKKKSNKLLTPSSETSKDSTQLNASRMPSKSLLTLPPSLMTLMPRKIFLQSSTTYKSSLTTSKRPSHLAELVKLWKKSMMLLTSDHALRTSNKLFKLPHKSKLTSKIRTFLLSSMTQLPWSMLPNKPLLIANFERIKTNLS